MNCGVAPEEPGCEVAVAEAPTIEDDPGNLIIKGVDAWAETDTVELAAVTVGVEDVKLRVAPLRPAVFELKVFCAAFCATVTAADKEAGDVPFRATYWFAAATPLKAAASAAALKALRARASRA